MAARGSGGMDTSQPAPTPAHRSGMHGSGATPPAKRPTERPHFEEPQGIVNMSHEELCRAFARLTKRYEQDVAWQGENSKVLADHAEKLDQNKEFFKVLVKEADRLDKRLDATQDIIQKNDEKVKEELSTNDGITKTAISSVNDKAEAAISALEAAHGSAVAEVDKLRKQLDDLRIDSTSARCDVMELAIQEVTVAINSKTNDTDAKFGKIVDEVLQVNKKADDNDTKLGKVADEILQMQKKITLLAGAFTVRTGAEGTGGKQDPWAAFNAAKGEDAGPRPQTFHMGSPHPAAAADGGEAEEAEEEDDDDGEGSGMPDFSRHKVKDVYDEKFAVQKENKHTDADPNAWMELIRSYMIGRNPVLDPILKWVESHGAKTIRKKAIAGVRVYLGLMTDLEPTIASEQLWSFLNLNTVGTSLREAFSNVEKLNGFEAWRKITEPILSTSVAMRISPRKTAWNSAPAKSIQDYGRCLEK